MAPAAASVAQRLNRDVPSIMDVFSPFDCGGERWRPCRLPLRLVAGPAIGRRAANCRSSPRAPAASTARQSHSTSAGSSLRRRDPLRAPWSSTTCDTPPPLRRLRRWEPLWATTRGRTAATGREARRRRRVEGTQAACGGTCVQKEIVRETEPLLTRNADLLKSLCCEREGKSKCRAGWGAH